MFELYRVPSVCMGAKSNARETLVVNRYLTGPIEFIQARQALWPENNVRGPKISSIRVGARRDARINIINTYLNCVLFSSKNNFRP
jgi:hypothetical protein